MKKLKLHWQILIALTLAVVFGIFFNEGVKYVSWMGDLFLNAMKMVIVPLVLTSIISGVTNNSSSKNLGRLSLKTISYYVTTSFLAIVTGLFLVSVIQPGIGADLSLVQEIKNVEVAKESFGKSLLEIIPENIFVVFSNNRKMLSVIFIALLFGFFITQASDNSKTILTGFFNSAFEVMMKITLFIIKFAPYGIFAIVAKTVAEQKDVLALFQSLGMYMLTVFLALLVHCAFTLPVLLKFIGKVNPLNYFKALSAPLLTAFSTASSSATLPLTMEAVEDNAGVSNKVTSFTLPLGATINMDGTALYECVAVIFIAQAYGMDLSVTTQIIIVSTALLASIGAAGIPMAGLIMMSIILSVVGLPLESIGLILAVDRPLDMLRTTTNVWSDSCGAAIIATSEGEQLKV